MFTALCPNLRYDELTNVYRKCTNPNCKFFHVLAQVRVPYHKQCRDFKLCRQLKQNCHLYHRTRELPFQFFARTSYLPFPIPMSDMSRVTTYSNEHIRMEINKDRIYTGVCPAIKHLPENNTFIPCRDSDCILAHSFNELKVPDRRMCFDEKCEGIRQDGSECPRFHKGRETSSHYFTRRRFVTIPLPLACTVETYDPTNKRVFTEKEISEFIKMYGKTQMCRANKCTRKGCYLAHSLEELRLSSEAVCSHNTDCGYKKEGLCDKFHESLDDFPTFLTVHKMLPLALQNSLSTK